MGLLPPTRGWVEIEGNALTLSGLRAWQSRIAHVPQSIYLSDASIAENISLEVSPERIDQKRLREAIQQSQLADFISSLPDGDRTPVGERGVRLSGGQRQRIGLARAIYKHAEVLILDEATSALDNFTENEVMKALDHSMANRTTFIIAHRLSTVQKCDRILVLDKGVVAGFASWDELAAQSVVFRQLASISKKELDEAPTQNL
jgi:ATP-binding cassette subfamily B protein